MKPNNTSTHSRIIYNPQFPFVEIRYTKESDRVYEAHAHPTLSIGIIAEGESIFHTPQGDFLLNFGALAIIEPHIQHTCNPRVGTKRTYFMLYLDTDFCLSIQNKLFQTTSTKLLPLKNPLVHHKALFEGFLSLMNAFLLENNALHVKALEAWLEKFFWLYTHRVNVPLSPTTIDDIAHFLSERLDEPVRLDMLASRFGLNPYVLIRRFKKAFGCPPKHYWLDLKIHHAKKLLQEGMPIALCAQYCGFSDQSHFHRFFKRKTALSPKEYQVNFIQ